MQWMSIVEYRSFGEPAEESSVLELEQQIGVALPAGYRRFLRTDGGGYLSDGLAECTVPTPFGCHNISELYNCRSVVNMLNSAVTPRNMICIGYGDFGATTCLSIAGVDHGHVFSLDTEMRFYWDDDTLEKLPDLDPTIREFFRLRDADELPWRPWGYENCYHIADSFSEFFEKLYFDHDE